MAYKNITRMYPVRINQPNFGPRIVTAKFSDLQAQDLSTIPCLFNGPGAPSPATLKAGFTPYIIGDKYDDTTNFKPYVCSTAGTNQVGSPGGSAWTLISGSATISFQIYNNGSPWGAGTVVRVATTQTIGGVTLTPGTYICATAVPSNATGNQIPQYPEPTSGTVYWYMINLGPQQFGICSGGSSMQIWVNASAPFS